MECGDMSPLCSLKAPPGRRTPKFIGNPSNFRTDVVRFLPSMKPFHFSLFFIMGIFLAHAGDDSVGVITGSRVNVRGRPLPTAELCCQLSKGDLVQILERKQVAVIGTNTEEWVRIVLPDKATVWLQSDLADEDGVVKKRAQGRAGPSLMWPVLCTLEKNQQVHVRTNEVNWIGIEPPPNASAWISGLLVTNHTEEIPTAPISKEK